MASLSDRRRALRDIKWQISNTKYESETCEVRIDHSRYGVEPLN